MPQEKKKALIFFIFFSSSGELLFKGSSYIQLQVDIELLYAKI